MAGVMVMVATTVHTTILVITMERGKLRMRLLPPDQTLTLMLMAGDTGEVTDVHTTEVTTMVRGKLRMRLLPLDQTLTLMLMAGDIGEDTVHTTEVTTGENKILANANVSSKYFSSNNNLVAPVVMVIW